MLDEMAYFTDLDPYASQTYSAVLVMRETGEKILADGQMPACRLQPRQPQKDIHGI